MSASPNPKVPAPDHFARRPLNHARQIESRCTWCGAVIVGSAAEHLQEDEENHHEHCPAISHKLTQN